LLVSTTGSAWQTSIAPRINDVLRVRVYIHNSSCPQNDTPGNTLERCPLSVAHSARMIADVPDRGGSITVTLDADNGFPISKTVRVKMPDSTAHLALYENAIAMHHRYLLDKNWVNAIDIQADNTPIGRGANNAMGMGAIDGGVGWARTIEFYVGVFHDGNAVSLYSPLHMDVSLANLNHASQYQSSTTADVGQRVKVRVRASNVGRELLSNVMFGIALPQIQSSWPVVSIGASLEQLDYVSAAVAVRIDGQGYLNYVPGSTTIASAGGEAHSVRDIGGVSPLMARGGLFSDVSPGDPGQIVIEFDLTVDASPHSVSRS
jgi:hypothetical protein